MGILGKNIVTFFLQFHSIDQSQSTQTSTSGKFKTSTHVTALDGIVNVNSLFTVAVFIGFSLTDPSATTTDPSATTDQLRSCNAGNNILRRIVIFEVFSFSWFLFSSLIAQTLKLYINLLNNSDRFDPHRAEVDRRLLKTGLLVSALGSVMGSVFLMLSISNFIQVKLGVFACGGMTIWSVVMLAVCVGSALVVYFITSMYALLYIA